MKRFAGMIRWGYALPRLGGVALVVLLLSFGLAPALHWLLIQTGQALTGAAVEIGELRTSVVHTELVLDNIQLANPSRPMKNSLQADSLRVDLSASALLRKKFVIQDGSIHGLRLDTLRTTSGALPETPAEEAPIEAEDEASEPLDLGWLAELGGDAQQRLLEEFETLRLSQKMLDIWPDRYTQLEAQVDDLAQRAKELKKRIRDFAKNGKKQPSDIIEMESEIRELHAQTEAVRQKITELVAKLDKDRRRLDEARRRDTAKIREIAFNEKLDAETITHYLLKKELADKIKSALDWLAWSREHIPRRVPETKPVPGKGLDIFFPGGRKIPDFLVERLQLDGELELSGRSLPFTGIATNFTSDPVLLGQPAMVRLQTTESVKVEVVAQFDRCGPTDRTSLSIDCPEIVQARRHLGSENQFALVVSPGIARFHGDFSIEADKLRGELTFLQQGVSLESRVGKKLGGERVAGYLQPSLAAIDRIEGRLKISGTPRRPRLRVESNLGGEIVAALEEVGRREIAHQRERLESQLAKLADKQSADLVARLESQQQQLAAKLGLADETVAALKKELVQHVGIPNQFLGKELPLGKFLK